MQKHKKQYFDKLHSNILLATKSYFPDATNKSIAKQIGISQTTFKKYLDRRYNHNPTKETKYKIKRFLIKLNDKGLEIGKIAEHLQRTKKRSLSQKQIAVLIARNKEDLKRIEDKLKENKNLIYKELWY